MAHSSQRASPRFTPLLAWAIGLLLILSACRPPQPQGPVGPGATTDNGNAIGQTFPTWMPTPFVPAPIREPRPSIEIQFLIDESGSVVADCPAAQSPNRHKVPLYLLTLFAKMANDSGAPIYMSVSLFSAKNETFRVLLSPTPASQLFQPANYKMWHGPLAGHQIAVGGGTNYVEGLKKAYEVFKGADKQMLVLLTDGFFSDQTQVQTKDELIEMAKAGIDPFVLLLCPGAADSPMEKESIAIWRGIDPFPTITPGTVTVLESDDPNVWLSTILSLDTLKEYLPPISGWVDGGVVASELSLEIASYARTSFSYEGYADANGVRIVSKSESIQSLQPDTEASSQLTTHFSNPDGACEPFEINVKPISPDDAGFFWAVSRVPEALSVTVTAGDLLNNEPVAFTAEVAPGDFDGKWLQFCYEPELQIQIANLDTDHQPKRSDGCNNSLCWSSNRLSASWAWQPPAFEMPQDVPFQVALRGRNGDVFSSERAILPEKFIPQLAAEPEITKKRGDLPLLVFDFTFQYDVQRPEVYATTNRTLSELKAITKRLEEDYNGHGCPEPEPNTSDYQVEQGKQPMADHPLVYSVQTAADTTTYVFLSFWYVIEDCGYSVIEFRWPDGARWQCTFSSQNKSDCKGP